MPRPQDTLKDLVSAFYSQTGRTTRGRRFPIVLTQDCLKDDRLDSALCAANSWAAKLPQDASREERLIVQAVQHGCSNHQDALVFYSVVERFRVRLEDMREAVSCPSAVTAHRFSFK